MSHTSLNSELNKDPYQKTKGKDVIQLQQGMIKTMISMITS